MTVREILEKAQDMGVEIDYCGSVSTFENPMDALFESEEYGFDDEQAKYHFSKRYNKVYLTIK